MVASGGEEEGGGGGEDEPELKQVPHLLLPHPGKTKEDWGGEVKGRKSKRGPMSRGTCQKFSLHAIKDINLSRLKCSAKEVLCQVVSAKLSLHASGEIKAQAQRTT